jgi:NTP pyrophosphatase (non-canonical NTP hydrolase)
MSAVDLKTDRSILELITAERRTQDEKWGVQDHLPVKWMSILMEEVGEAAKAVLDNRPVEYQRELIQVAAVAMAAIESLRRNKEI